MDTTCADDVFRILRTSLILFLATPAHIFTIIMIAIHNTTTAAAYNNATTRNKTAFNNTVEAYIMHMSMQGSGTSL